METFQRGERVLVLAAGVHKRVVIPGGAKGTVVRCLMSSRAAWIALDERLPIADVHPFVDQERATQVCAYPEDCELQQRPPERADAP